MLANTRFDHSSPLTGLMVNPTGLINGQPRKSPSVIVNSNRRKAKDRREWFYSINANAASNYRSLRALTRQAVFVKLLPVATKQYAPDRCPYPRSSKGASGRARPFQRPRCFSLPAWPLSFRGPMEIYQ